MWLVRQRRPLECSSWHTQVGVFVGNANANTMQVGSGDTMTGGAGADTFVFKSALAAAATITDFTHGTDVLQISASGFGHGLVAEAAPAFVTAVDIASASHAGAGGYFIFDNSGVNAGTVYWDLTGGSGSDAHALVHLNSVASLLPSDFHLDKRVLRPSVRASTIASRTRRSHRR